MLGIDDAVGLGAGPGGACAARADGSLWCWGSGRTSPVPIEGVHDAVDVTLAGGGPTDPWGPMPDEGAHACVLHASGRVSCWGDDDHGQLGDGAAGEGRELPSEPVVGIEDAVEISGGGLHTCVLRATGGVACWGNGDYCQLGGGACGSSPTPVLPTLPGRAIAIAAGADATVAVLEDGSPYIWGFTRYEGGDSGRYVGRPEPVAVWDGTSWDLGPLGPVRAIDPDRWAARIDGTVVRWGMGPWDGPGSSFWAGSLVPAVIDGMPTDIVQLEAPCARTSAGQVWCRDAEAGTNRVEGLDGVVELDAGPGFRCARHDDGRISCWGSNAAGELGSGARGIPFSDSPVEVVLPP